MHYAPSTQPEPYRQIIARSITLYRIAFSKVFPEALLLALIFFLSNLLFYFGYFTLPIDIASFNLQGLLFLVIDIICLTLFTALLWRMRCVIKHAHETVSDDMRISLRKLPFIIAAALIQTTLFLFIWFTTILFVRFYGQAYLLAINDPVRIFLLSIPLFFQGFLNIYIFFLLIFYQPLILTENKAIFTALFSSAKLVWKNWWRTFSVLLTPVLCYVLVLILIQVASGLHIPIYFFRFYTLSLPAILVHIFVFTLFLPWFASILLIQLHDLELRKKLATKLSIS
jgi:hypothetical protein